MGKIINRNGSKYPRHKREISFMLSEAKNKNFLIYQPKNFYLKNGTRYTPDFYSPKYDKYYEYVGTRQAWSANKKKVYKFQKEYADIKFEVIRGDLSDSVYELYPETLLGIYLKKEKITLTDFALNNGFTIATISNVVKGNECKTHTLNRIYKIIGIDCSAKKILTRTKNIRNKICDSGLSFNRVGVLFSINPVYIYKLYKRNSIPEKLLIHIEKWFEKNELPVKEKIGGFELFTRKHCWNGGK